MQKQSYFNSLILLLTSAIWGFSFVAQRNGMEYVGPFTFNGIRFALGAVSLLPLYYYLKIQIDFFEPVLIPAIRQKLFNRGQFGLTPVKNIFILCPLGIKCPLICIF